MRTIIRLLALCAVCVIGLTARGREFAHPGAIYSQSDLDRMRAMVEARQEPYYSAFLKLKNSSYSKYVQRNRGTAIAEGKFNQTVGEDGRRAHDMALLWHITGDKTYADNVVKILNTNSHYTNTSSRGTAPLDNGKIFLLLQAAELLRDYPGWAKADQDRFKSMLVHPGYSSTQAPTSHYSLDDALNDVTFYWNIYNFDASRFGNQGLFAARALMAMGIYLDNEKMYDRAYRYLMGLPHRPDDLAYPSGPPITASKPYALDADNPESGDRTTSFMLGYELRGRENTVEDYGYDEQLQYYIYPNGQTQEACRDQDHALVGSSLYIDIAEMAWNQGDDLYGALDSRILKGMEWTYRYNLSYILNPAAAWEPSGYTRNPAQAEADDNLFYQVRSRSGRWESVKPSTKGRGDSFLAGGNRECGVAHYAVRMSMPDDRTSWSRRYLDYMTGHFGYESYGKDANHAYEWAGWGTLTKHRDKDMAGDPGAWADGRFTPGLKGVGDEICFADYDRHNVSASSHTCSGTYLSDYRTDNPGMDISPVGGKYAVTSLKDGDWMLYTVNIRSAARCDIIINYEYIPADSRSASAPSLTISIGGVERTVPLEPAAQTAVISDVDLKAGVGVAKVTLSGISGSLALRSMKIAEASHSGIAGITAGDAPFSIDGRTITPAGDAILDVYDLSGRHIASASHCTATLTPGFYIIVSQGRRIKIIIG